MSTMCTKVEAKKRRVRLLAWVLQVLPPDEVAAYLQSPKPPDLEDLILHAKRRAAEKLRCAHCGGSLLDGAEAPKPSFFTTNARARACPATKETNRE
jgi:hypothetical protein